MTAPLVLFVDDEAGVVSACKRALRREPWEIRITTSADEALQLIAAEDFAVVVSDQRMPAMDGAELLRQVSQLKPDTVRIILTGHADIDSAVDAINRGHVFRLLGKPWND
ncbi:MAG: response regulator, partial [Planctomycetales bacterium]|nr:response regulator [Planctomycetales bacterium]